MKILDFPRLNENTVRVCPPKVDRRQVCFPLNY